MNHDDCHPEPAWTKRRVDRPSGRDHAGSVSRTVSAPLGPGDGHCRGEWPVPLDVEGNQYIDYVLALVR
jgi:hypothetical protein